MSVVPDEFVYELVIDEAGTCVLTCGGEILWTSDDDDEFAEEFPDRIEYDDEEQTGEVIEWLESQGYIPPNVEITIVEDDSAATGNFQAIDEDGEGDNTDEDDDDENL
jgi:hypothetical protein